MILNCLNMRSLRFFRKRVWQNAQKKREKFSHFLQEKTGRKRAEIKEKRLVIHRFHPARKRGEKIQKKE